MYFYISLLVVPWAVWRVANMLADTEQHGPFGLLDKLRYKAGLRYDAHAIPYAEPGSLAEGMTCVYCNSTWIGLFFTILLFVSPVVAFWISLPLALSAVAILLEKRMV